MASDVVAREVGCCFLKLMKKHLPCFEGENLDQTGTDDVDSGSNDMVHVSNNVNVTCCGSTGRNVNDDDVYMKSESIEKKNGILTLDVPLQVSDSSGKNVNEDVVCADDNSLTEKISIPTVDRAPKPFKRLHRHRSTFGGYSAKDRHGNDEI